MCREILSEFSSHPGEEALLQTYFGIAIVIYLCLGAAGAGLAGVAAFFYLNSRARFLSAIKVSIWSSLVFLIVGLGFLFVDLGRPLQALNIFNFSNFGSWATRGFWLLLTSMIVYALLLIVVSMTSSRFIALRWGFYKNIREALATILSWATIILSFCLAFYTGMLLYECLGIPFWGTLLLPILFLSSSTNIGLCLFLWINALSPSQFAVTRSRRMSVTTRVAVILLLVEAIVLTLYLVWASESNIEAVVQSFNHLVFGELTLLFWLCVVLSGYIIPAFTLLLGSSLLGQRQAKVFTTITMVGLAIGLVALRYGILFSGIIQY